MVISAWMVEAIKRYGGVNTLICLECAAIPRQKVASCDKCGSTTYTAISINRMIQEGKIRVIADTGLMYAS